MSVNEKLIAFGPVPSRRLGHSVGINNIPPKICTYSCIYCQVGRTINMKVDRQRFYDPEEIVRNVEKKVEEAKSRGEPIDYLTFVPDGEPTLDICLGDEIKLLKKLGIKIAVITNASLIGRRDVRDDLLKADWVSVKIDAVSRDIWRKIDRPHGSLNLDEIKEGITRFSKIFTGFLATETMIIDGVNDMPEEMEKVADFIAGVNPGKSYLSIPTRPPAEKTVFAAKEHALSLAYHLFLERNIAVEYLIGYEGNAFAFTGNVKNDLLSITSVHPMREDAVKEYLMKAHTGWHAVEKLIKGGELIEVDHQGNKFYLRTFQHQHTRHSS
jgi:wyosine [tRNA(Phe)-imidazoG37] synthetase (radical SAM superfamily)